MQKPKQLIDDVTERTDRAVSPVIGVILMVAITVILAAVIGTFVLDLGQSTGNTAPQLSVGVQDFDGTINEIGSSNTGENLLSIDHSGGEDIDVSNLRVEVRDPNTGEVFARFNESNSYKFDQDASAGDEFVLQINGINASTSDTYRSGDTLVIKEGPSINLAKANIPWDKGSEVRVVLIDENSGKQISSSTVTVE